MTFSIHAGISDQMSKSLPEYANHRRRVELRPSPEINAVMVWSKSPALRNRLRGVPHCGSSKEIDGLLGIQGGDLAAGKSQMPTLYACRAVTLALILSSIAAISTTSARAGTQCACPNVPATGVGNTSCSAAESNGHCTVDFNIFFEREARAVSLLSRAGVEVRVPDPNLGASDGLARLVSEPSQLADAILVYLTVALSALPNANELTQVVQRIASTVRSGTISSRLVTAFDPSAGVGLPRSDNLPLDNFDGTRGRVVRGCIELFSGDTWVIFKTNWSPYSATPRCGGER